MTVRLAVRLAPLWAAVMVTGVDAPTLDDVAVNVAFVAPAGTVTLADTLATPGLLLESDTTAPPAGAALESVTVPCELDPPVTLVGLRLIAWRVAVGSDGGLLLAKYGRTPTQSRKKSRDVEPATLMTRRRIVAQSTCGPTCRPRRPA